MAYNNPHLSPDLPLHHFTEQRQQQQNTISPDDPTTKPASDHHQTAPNWLNNTVLRTHYTDNDKAAVTTSNNGTNFLNLHTTASDCNGPASQSSNKWLARPILHRNHSDVIDNVAGGDSTIAGATLSHESADLKTNGDILNNKAEAVVVDGDGLVNWRNARHKAEILANPLYEQLLSAHVACLRIATPVDQLPRIDAQLAQSENVVAKYSALGHAAQDMVGDDKELDQFLVFSKFL